MESKDKKPTGHNDQRPNFVHEFNDRLTRPSTASDIGGPIAYLYEHRNDMSKDEFEECVVAYGQWCYEEG